MQRSLEFSFLTAMTIDTLSIIFPPKESNVIMSDAKTETIALMGTPAGNVAIGLIDYELSLRASKRFLRSLYGTRFSVALLISSKPYPEKLKDEEHEWTLGDFAFQIMDVEEAIRMVNGILESEVE